MKIFFAVVVIVLLFVIGATLYVYKKSAMFLPALLGICGFPKIKESSYYDDNGDFRAGTGEDKVGFFMQHPVFGGFKHMFFNVEDNVLKAIAPIKYKDFLRLLPSKQVTLYEKTLHFCKVSCHLNISRFPLKRVKKL